MSHLSEVIPLDVEVVRVEWNAVHSLARNVGDVGNLYCVSLGGEREMQIMLISTD